MLADGKPTGCKCERLLCSCVLSNYREVASEKTDFTPSLCTLCFAGSFMIWLMANTGSWHFCSSRAQWLSLSDNSDLTILVSFLSVTIKTFYDEKLLS